MTDPAASPAASPEGAQQKKKKKKTGPSTSKQAKAGLTFAVSRVDKKLRQAKIAKQVASQASIHMTSVVEHVVLKVLKDAGAQAAMRKSKRVTDVHIVAAVRSDPDVARAFAGFCFASAADVPKAVDRILPDEEQKERRLRKLERAELKKQAAQAGAQAGAEADAVQD